LVESPQQASSSDADDFPRGPSGSKDLSVFLAVQMLYSRGTRGGTQRVHGMTPATAPESAPETGRTRLRFAVQKHQARSLHYDFRLEIGAVLVSWAVPKGPSKDPKVKRLAVRVPDHPIDYLLFEGDLPEGDYGAGEIIVWDHGEYEVVGPAGNDEAAALGDGIIRFTLYGTKLRGLWAIFRTRMGQGSRENWLLEKIRDEFAVADYSPESEPQSALSGKVLRGRR
jgi:bifunctional non-homologous end joining protein LigD